MTRIQYFFILCTVCICPLYLLAMPGNNDIQHVYLYDLDDEEIHQKLESGDLLSLSKLPRPFNLMVTVSGNPGSVEIQVDGETSSTVIDNSAHYMFPDENTSWTPQPGSYIITIKTYTEPNGEGTISDIYTLSVDVCDNVSNGGHIGGHEAQCGAYDPGIIYNETLPSGGSGTLEYVWMKSTTTSIFTGSNSSEWSEIPNSNSPTLDPDPIAQTNYYIRCARRGICDVYPGESNVIKKEVISEPWVFTSLDQNICSGEIASIIGGAYQSFESLSNPGSYMGHNVIYKPGWSTYGRLVSINDGSSTADKERSSFRVVEGLYNQKGISFESISQPGYYLRESNGYLKLHPIENTASWKESVSFYVREGLGSSEGISFESVESPNKYIRLLSNNLFVVDEPESDAEEEDATFVQHVAWEEGALELEYEWSIGSMQPKIVVQPTRTTEYTLTANIGDCTYQSKVEIVVDNCQVISNDECEGVLGAAAPYNLLIFEDISSMTDAVQGRVAVGGNVQLYSMQIGQDHNELGSKNLESDPSRADLIVGGDIIASSGVQVNHGGLSFTGNFLLDGGGFTVLGSDGHVNINEDNADSYRLPPPFDFSFVKFQMDRLSLGLAQLTSNIQETILEGTYHKTGNELILTGNGAGYTGTTVFFLNESDFSSVATFTLQDVSMGATVIINVGGEQVELGSFGWEGFDSHTNRIMFNFYEASYVSVRSMKGSILAPSADFQSTSGEIWGQVIAKSVDSYSQAQIHHHPFNGCIFPVLTYGDDFGDAPESYQSASHIYDASRGGLITYMGSLIDFETDPFYTVHACGDDNDVMNDEDGITFPGGAIAAPGETKSLDIVVYSELQDVFVNIWMDFNGDGDFQDENEHIIFDEEFDNPNKPSGEVFYRTVHFTIPEDAVCGQTFMRARLLSDPGIGAYGTGVTGEVEDYMFTINCDQGGAFDYGDAPLIYGDASHEIQDGVSIGNTVDSESGTQHTSFATGDDTQGEDDEDGVIFFDGPLIRPGTDKHFTVNIQNSSGVTYYLSAWADTDIDGTFETQLINDIPFDQSGTYSSAETQIPLRIPTSFDLCGKEVFVRFRLSNEENVSYDTQDIKGEVEDYALIVTCEVEEYQEQGILPVEYLSFEGEAHQQQVRLTWITATETNNSHFEIQRSVDGDEFTGIGTVNGEGTTTDPTYYSYADTYLGEGIVYYRLKQFDIDGKYEYSNIIEVVLGTSSAVFATHYPNPVRDQLYVNLNRTFDSRVEISFVDMLGHVVSLQQLNNANLGREHVVSTRSLPSGIYILTITDGIYTYKSKIVKK